MAIVAAILGMLLTLIPAKGEAATIVVIPPMPQATPIANEQEWELYRAEAEQEYADAFTALFNSYEVKRAKNGALMIRKGDSGSYRFAKKGK
jgi:hypothetical protein